MVASDLPEMVRIADAPGRLEVCKYPVTVHQYALFLRATGWREPRHWPNSPDQSLLPVSWVNHFDANAYCFWLAQVQQCPHFLPSTRMLTLAARSKSDVKEAEAKVPTPAARPGHMGIVGQAMVETDRRVARAAVRSKFPWGPAPDPRQCNCKEYRPHRPGPTPVEKFEASASYDGIVDLSGNLWEMSGSFTSSGSSGKIEPATSFLDPTSGFPDWLHFKTSWQTTLSYIKASVENTVFGWESQFDLFGGCYATDAAACTTDDATAFTAPSNCGPYAGFRVARIGRRNG